MEEAGNISHREIDDFIINNQLIQAEQAVKSLLAENAEDAQAYHYYAVIAFKAGKVEYALRLAQNATTYDPENSVYLNTVGYLLRVTGDLTQSADYLKKSVLFDGENIEALNNHGITSFELGRFSEAAEMYHRALAIKKEQPDVLNNLGNVYARQEKYEEAIRCFDEALALNPSYAQAWANKGETILRRSDIGEDARKEAYAECIEKAAGLAPGWLDLQNKYANLLSGRKDVDKAEQVLRAALEVLSFQVGHVPLIMQLARILDQKMELDEALLWARQAVMIMPENVYALQVMAHISLRIGNPVEAMELYKKALTIQPDSADLHYGLGNSYMRLEKIQDALDCYLKVHNMDKSNPRGVFAPAACLLLNGEYEKGWAAYESRYRVGGFKPNVPDVMHRLWDGSPLGNRHLVVHVEQGYGDTFQFCRYLGELRKKEPEAKISFLCEPETLRLMNGLEGPDHVYSLGDKLEITYDVQVPLLSLPHRLGTTLQTVPARVPYLHPLKDNKVKLRPVEGTKLNVGVVWAGRPTHSDDRYRSVDINLFAQLFDVKEVAFYALQWGERSDDLAPWLESHSNVRDDREGLVDFADTAAFINELDLVITVDTSVAHLAGALGKPVWILIPYGAEWRWMLNHERTPWYPDMRLYRQKVLGHWSHVFDRVKKHLGDVLETR